MIGNGARLCSAFVNSERESIIRVGAILVIAASLAMSVVPAGAQDVEASLTVTTTACYTAACDEPVAGLDILVGQGSDGRFMTSDVNGWSRVDISDLVPGSVVVTPQTGLDLFVNELSCWSGDVALEVTQADNESAYQQYLVWTDTPDSINCALTLGTQLPDEPDDNDDDEVTELPNTGVGRESDAKWKANFLATCAGFLAAMFLTIRLPYRRFGFRR